MAQLARRAFLPLFAFSLSTLGLSCSSDDDTADTTTPAPAPAEESPTTTQAPAVDLPDVVVTYSVLASVVSELVTGVADVVTIIPDGQDPHDFEPSAKDIAAINDAVFVVANGLNFEEGLETSLEELHDANGPVFFVGEHITVRDMTEGDDHAHGSEEESKDETGDEHAHSDGDPHLWLSPAAMLEMLPELASELGAALGTDLSAALATVTDGLTAHDSEVAALLGDVEPCELITGHDELGYFADRYGCEVIGAVIPSSTTTSEASAGELAELKEVILEHSAKVVFVSLGTPQAVAEQIAKETGTTLVELSTHSMGGSTTYAEFVQSVAKQIADALK